MSQNHPSQQEFQNSDYKVLLTRDSGCRVSFKIEVGGQAVKSLLQKAVKAVNKGISLPGFRKGKVPENLVIQHFSKDVEKEWRNEVLQEAFVHAMRLTEVHPFRKDSVQGAKIPFLSREGAEVIVEFEAMPDIPEIDISKVKWDQIEPEAVTETKINQIIEDIRYQYADWTAVSNRPVQEGDFVDVDIEDLDVPGKFICQNTRIEVAKGKLGTWLHELLLGMNIDEKKEETSREEEGAHNPNFHPVRCLVTVKGINVSSLPPLDDELAKKVGLQTATELHDRIASDLKRTHEEVAREKTRHNLERAIARTYSFEIPNSIIAAETNKALTRKAEQLTSHARGEKSLAEEMSAYEEELKNEVEESCRWHFIAQKFASKHNIEVDRQEVISELVKRRYLNPETGRAESARQDETPNDVLITVYNHLISDKVADLLLAQKKSGD